ncbi:unnamed protein product [Polarella glacialis]|uniref:MYND-type domain-containing protein n=2 Tax=Polarella glacialis TaxID=89957 RepID=A0A813GFA0_POLGL|nr:unnamed protein product [Polarella glacialis]
MGRSTGVLPGSPADWLSALLSGSCRMGCWSCGSEFREQEALDGISSVCSCSGKVCPARYCGAECKREDWDRRHGQVCQHLCKAMAAVTLKNCESRIASDLAVIMPCLLTIQGAIVDMERDSSFFPSDMSDMSTRICLDMSTRILLLKCLASVQTAASNELLSSGRDEVEAHSRYLRNHLVVSYLDRVLSIVEAEGFEETVFSKSIQREALQFAFAARHDSTEITDRNAIIEGFDPVPNILEITSDVVLGHRSRALGKLIEISCKWFKEKGQLGSLFGDEVTASQIAVMAVKVGGKLSENAARLAHALAASEAKHIMRDGRRRSEGPDCSFNLSDVFAWQPMAMPPAAAAAAQLGLELAEKWMRLAFLCQKQSYKMTAWEGCGDRQDKQATVALLFSQAHCGVFTARHALASFVASFNRQDFGECIFGPSMALDMLYQAFVGLKAIDPSDTATEKLQQDLEGFTGILLQITKIINRRSLGSRWRFIHRGKDDARKLVYIDDEAKPFWNHGRIAVVLHDSFADMLMQSERSQGQHVAISDAGPLQLTRMHVSVRRLTSLADGDYQVDREGVFLGELQHQARFPDFLEGSKLDSEAEDL